jgi:hypothetical protein
MGMMKHAAILCITVAAAQPLPMTTHRAPLRMRDPRPARTGWGAPDRGSVEGPATPADGNDVIATTVSQDRCPASGRISDDWPNAGHQTRQHGRITWT